MRVHTFVAALVTVLGGTISAPAWGQEYAITEVDVLTMESPELLRGCTVLINGDRISALGPSNAITIPPTAIVIDGKGKYLMPGLTDMHIHMWDERELMLYLANGITTVRNMWGAAGHISLRQQIRSGALAGPELYTTGPLLEGVAQWWPASVRVMTAEEGRARVQEYKQAGYDFIKIYHTILDRAVYDAIFDEAVTQNIPVVGHVPQCSPDTPHVNVQYPADRKMKSIEHTDMLWAHVMNIPYYVGNPLNYYTTEIDSQRALDMSEILALAETWVCPTFAIFRNMITLEEFEEALQRPYMEYVPYSRAHVEWRPDANVPPWWPQFCKLWRTQVPEMKMVNLMHHRGVKLLTGTDNLNPFTIAGFSLHQELAIFVEAGFSPYEVLEICTRNAAEFMGRSDEFGRIAKGLRADMILLNRNPLENIAHVQDRTGVMVRGRWYTDQWLRREINKAYQASPRRPTLVHPANNSTIPGLSDSLVWNDVFSVTEGYRVQVSSDSLLTAMMIDDTVSASIASPRPDTTYKFVLADGRYWWSVTGINNLGSGPKSGLRSFTVGTVDVTSGHTVLPADFAVHQNYPNPFNPSTTIVYELPKSSVVTLSMYDILGREVFVLVNERRDAGVHEVKFDASGLSSGVYLYRLTAGSFVETRKLVLVR